MDNIVGYNDCDNYSTFSNESCDMPPEFAPLISSTNIQSFNSKYIENIDNKISTSSKIFDLYKYATNKNAKQQYLNYIDPNDEALLNKYLPIIYTDKNDNFKFINPNYYLEFTEVLFDNKIIGYKNIIDDTIYLCYNIFYEKTRNVSSSKSHLTDRILTQYVGNLFSVILICIELNLDSFINNIILSSNLDSESNYQIIKPKDNTICQPKIFISKEKHNLYLLNDSIDKYENYITDQNEKYNQITQTFLDFEYCLIKDTFKNNQNIIKYFEIKKIDTIVVSKPYTKSIWRKPKIKFIPLWFYRILPTFLSKLLFDYKY
jgi:hypothetical protein